MTYLSIILINFHDRIKNINIIQLIIYNYYKNIIHINNKFKFSIYCIKQGKDRFW